MELHPQLRFRVWILLVDMVDLQRNVCERSAKKVVKEKVSMEAYSPHSTFAASREPGNTDTLLFPGAIIPTWPCIYP